MVNSLHIVVVGLNYRTAPVEVRERFAISAEQLPAAVRQLNASQSILECVIVVTCNRSELYVVVDTQTFCPKSVIDFMETWFNLSYEIVAPYTYAYSDQEAIEHLMRVTVGLDSMILGETQILGQIRNAFLSAQREGATGTIFNMLFKQAITFAKRAHAETAIGEHPVSVSYAAVELGKRILGSYNGKCALIIGAGKMGELTALHLHANDPKAVHVINRTMERAIELADKLGGQAFPYERLPQLLLEADFVISSTASAEMVLSYQQVEQAMQQRPTRPLLMIDIAVPRDLDPNIQHVPNVHLYDIDDLAGMIEANWEQRQQAAATIELLIGEEVMAFQQWYLTLGVGPLIQALQSRASQIHHDTMSSLRNKLPELSEREWKTIQKLTKSMLNQMLTHPIQRIKEMAPEQDRELALDYFMRLFALEEAVKNDQQIEPPQQESLTLT